jgi:hypothetical protein
MCLTDEQHAEFQSLKKRRQKRMDLAEWVRERVFRPVILPILLPPEQEAAWKEIFLAKKRQQRLLDALHATPAVKRPGCGAGRKRHIRKVEQDCCTDALLIPFCGRNDCAFCWRRRVTDKHQRAYRCLLFVHSKRRGEKKRDVRTEPLYVGRADWGEHRRINRAIRHAHGKACGRVQVRTEQDEMLLVCEQPFDGAEKVAPPLALDRVHDALAHLAKKRHAYRQLGRWSDKEPSAWKLLEQFEEPVDFHQVERTLAELGHSCQPFKRTDIRGRIWETANEREADELFRQLAQRCHFSPYRKSRPKSDTAGEDGRTPFDPDPGETGWS